MDALAVVASNIRFSLECDSRGGFIFAFHNYSRRHRSVRWLAGIQFVADVVAMKYLCHRMIDTLIVAVVVCFDDMLVLYAGCSFVCRPESIQPAAPHPKIE